MVQCWAKRVCPAGVSVQINQPGHLFPFACCRDGLFLQKKVLDRRIRATRQELRIAIVTWIERTYHRRRRQRRLARWTPVEYETIMTSAAPLAG